MEEPIYLVCLPVINNPDGKHLAKGSIKTSCAKCNREVWIAPTGQKISAEKGAIVICIPCSMRMAKEESFQEMSPTPEQKDEINKTLGKNIFPGDDQTP